MHAIRVQIVLWIFSLKAFSAKTILKEYQLKKQYIIDEESNIALGGDVELTKEEQAANEILMKLKHEEFDNYFQHPEKFHFTKYFHQYKNCLKRSKVYQIIKRMPKGAALHLHSTLTHDADYFMNLTYSDFLYACYTKKELQLQFSGAPPTLPCETKWILLSTLRAKSDNVEKFDEELKQFFKLYPNGKYTGSDINTIWQRFEKVYRLMKALIIYRPYREKFFYDFLQKCYDDNVMYVEIRSGLHQLQDLDGSVHDPIYMAKLYRDVMNNFKKNHPDFIGMKLILSRHRQTSMEELKEALSLAKKLQEEVPEIFAGFDLVGQEDLGKPLSYFLPALIEAKDNGLNFFFHAGETNWHGSPSDSNLIDAILLESKRIGHGYSLIRHPLLMSILRKEDIAVEVNIVSNHELSLLKDIRNHPLGTYISLGIPVVISSDDPGVWGSDILTTDFYLAFMVVASRDADLRLLKQLALNSIKYSTLNRTEKKDFNNKFDIAWNKFIESMIDTATNYTEHPITGAETESKTQTSYTATNASKIETTSESTEPSTNISPTVPSLINTILTKITNSSPSTNASLATQSSHKTVNYSTIPELTNSTRSSKERHRRPYYNSYGTSTEASYGTSSTRPSIQLKRFNMHPHLFRNANESANVSFLFDDTDLDSSEER